MTEIVKQDNGCSAEELSETERRLKYLENEVYMFTRAGIVEVAVRNPSVMEYMKHWEGRAEKAEAEVTRLTTALENARKDAWLECREEAADTAYLQCLKSGNIVRRTRNIKIRRETYDTEYAAECKAAILALTPTEKAT